ncbi:MAG: Spy/CpxP family protein refolding chaperone [Pseudolabrys sp.]
MHGRTILLIMTLSATILLPDAGRAQLSPQGVIGGITRPFRQMLGHFGHFPRARYHRAVAAESRVAAPISSSETSASAGSRLGWAGPPAWPGAYEDILGFTFWPDDYASRLRGRGFDVIADTITGRFDLPRPSARTATTGAAVRNDADNETSVERCGDTSNTESNWPTVRVEQILQLSDAQHAALEKLQSAAAQSVNKIRDDCRGPGALAPPDRLRALVQTLWTLRDAGISVREPVNNFYDALTNTQKNAFASQQPQRSPHADPKAADNGMNKQYQACISQNAEKAERLIKEIEMRVRPNKDQAASLENLHKISADMAKLLIASCAQPIPADPVARLDATGDQLTAMNYAATTVQIAFDDFYLKLNYDQKTRFELPRR